MYIFKRINVTNLHQQQIKINFRKISKTLGRGRWVVLRQKLERGERERGIRRKKAYFGQV